MMLMVPERQLLLFAIFGIEALFILGVTVLALGHWRLPPLPLAFALAFSLTVEMSCLLAFVPELRTPSLMLLALLPPAIALFAPWSITVQAGLLLAGALVGTVVTVASPRGAVQTEWLTRLHAGHLGRRESRWLPLDRPHPEGERSSTRWRREALTSATIAREAELRRLNGRLALVTRTDPDRPRQPAAAGRGAHCGRSPGGPLRRRLRDRTARYRWLQELQRRTWTYRRRRCPPGRRDSFLAASVRATDTVCRFGGDEFVVLMPVQPLPGAARAVERMRRAIEDLQLQYPRPSGPQVLTISAGIALLGRSAAHDEDEILRRADAELYRAKEAGRNRVALPRLSTDPSPLDQEIGGSSPFSPARRPRGNGVRQDRRHPVVIGPT